MQPEQVIQSGIDVLADHFKKLGFKSLRRPGVILVFLDNDNYVEFEPKHVCIPCEHDPVERQKKEEERNEAIHAGD